MLNQNKTYFIETYGCQMNVADSEIVETLLIDKGYKKSLNRVQIIDINEKKIKIN